MADKLAVQVHERLFRSTLSSSSSSSSSSSTNEKEVDAVLSLHVWETDDAPQLIAVQRRTLRVYDLRTTNASGVVGGDAILALDIRNGNTLPEFVATDNATPLTITQFAASSQRLFLTTAQGGLRALDLRWPRSEIVWAAHTSSISALALSERDERVFTGGADGLCRAFDVAQIARSRPRADSTLISTSRCRAVFAGHTEQIIDLLFANDLLFSASADKTLRVWSDKAGVANPCLLLISINRDLSAFRLAVNSKHIFLYAHTARSVLVLDETTGGVLHKLQGHTDGVHHVVSDGLAYMLTCSADGTLRKWSVRSGTCLAELTGHTAAVTCALVHGKHIYSGSDDGSVREWANLDLSAREAVLAAANVVDVPSLSRARQLHTSNDVLVTSEQRARKFTVLRAKVEQLDLANRKLRKIVLVPKDAANMDLLELRANGNMLDTAPRNLLKENPRLRLLTLDNNHLKSLALPRLPALAHLYLTYNRIKELPADIGRLLPALQTLFVDHNPALKALPESLLMCTALERLSASYCALTRLPSQLERLVDLRDINFEFNRLYKLPLRLGDLRKLRNVALNSNQLTDLPGSILRLFSNGVLQQLVLLNNPFSFPLDDTSSLAALELTLRRAFDPTRDVVGDFGKPLPPRPTVTAPRYSTAARSVVVSDVTHRGAVPMPASSHMDDDDNDEGPQAAGIMSINEHGVATFVAPNAEPPRIPSMRESASAEVPAVPANKPSARRRRANADAATQHITPDEVMPVASYNERASDNERVVRAAQEIENLRAMQLPGETVVVLPQQPAPAASSTTLLVTRYALPEPPPPAASSESAPMPWDDLNLTPSARANLRPKPDQYGIVRESGVAGLMYDDQHADRDIDNVSEIDPNEHVASEDVVIALCAYTATRPAELSFVADDQLQVFDRDPSGWWRGMVLGHPNMQIGLFPKTYVKELELLQLDADSSRILEDGSSQSMRLLDQAIESGTAELKSMMDAVKAETAVAAVATATTAPAASRISASASASTTKSATEEPVQRQSSRNMLPLAATDYNKLRLAHEVVEAAHAYAPTKAKELAFAKGDQLLVLRKVQERGWWFGCRVEQPGKSGFFPSTFIKQKATEASVAAGRARAPTLELVNGAEAVMATSDYEAEDVVELTLHRFDVVDVLKKNHKTGWWKGMLRAGGAIGWFPSQVVERFPREAP